MGGYSLGDAARICGVQPARLRSWERARLLAPEWCGRPKATFDFADLVSARSIVALLQQGVPLRRIRHSVERLRESLPEVERPLPALRVSRFASDRVAVRHDGVLVEPEGQLLLDLEPRGDENVAPIERRRDPLDPQSLRDEADAWFERGCKLDSDRPTFAEAIEAYQQAIEIDPEFADAHCNLGSVYYNQDRRGRARACFEAAIDFDPHHVEAHLNLATLFEEEGRLRPALGHYRIALEADPLSADTHVSLALLYGKLELPRKGRTHWRRYLQLDPTGAWADLARRHLES